MRLRARYVAPRSLEWRMRTVGDVARAIVGEDVGLSRAVDVFVQRYGTAVAELEACRRFQRLAEVSVFGVQASHEALAGLRIGFAETKFVRLPLLSHDRAVHSRHVAGHGLALALQLGCSYAECALIVFAGLLHDLGHTAYSHGGDHVLVRHGAPSHELRGMQWVREDAEIRASLGTAGLAPADVVRVMAEQGALGVIQSIADTAGYLVLDTEVYGFPLGFAFAERLFGAIDRIQDGVIHATARERLQHFLDVRAVMYRDLYDSPRSRVFGAFFAKVITWLLEERQLAVHDLERGTDETVRAQIVEALQRSGTPSWVRDAWRIARGDKSVRTLWAHTEHLVPETVLAKARDPRTVQLVPHDYTAKCFRVRVGRRVLTLQAASEFLSPFSRRWHTFEYIGA